jgi:cell division septum initiation protein DivIVA
MWVGNFGRIQMADEENFDIVMRGYDRTQVDSIIDEMRVENEHLSTYNESAVTEIANLKSEMELLKEQLRNSGQSGYAALGAQFEQTLRLAEEQANKMIADAGQDAVRIRDEARGAADLATRTAKDKADRIVQEAEIKVEEAKFEVERKANSMLQTATSRETEATEKIQTAEREAAAIKSDGERYAAELRAQVHRETEQARALATELSQRTAQARIDLEAELKAKRDESEQEALRIYQAAVAQAQTLTDEGARALAESSTRAAELMAEAERISREARIFQDETREEANKRATDLINQSRRRSEALSRKALVYAENAVKDARERLTKLSDEKDQVSDFLASMDKLMSTESMVNVDHSEVDESSN